MTSEEFANIEIGDTVGFSPDGSDPNVGIVFYSSINRFVTVDEDGNLDSVDFDDLLLAAYDLLPDADFDIQQTLTSIRNKIEDLEDIALILKRL